MGCETEHFEAFKTQPRTPRSPGAILPRISEDGVIVSFLFFFLFRSLVAFTRIRPSLCKNTRRGIRRDETIINGQRDCGRSL